MQQRIFVTHVIKEEFIKSYHIATAGCNFSYNLISGHGFDKVYSILPTNVGCVLDKAVFQDQRYTLIYYSWFRTKGRIFRFVASFLEQIKIFSNIPEDSSVWTYNVTDLNLFLIYLLRIFKRSVKINVIELDYTPVSNKFSIANLCLKTINNADGNIRLADSDRFTCKNAVILPGVVPVKTGDEPVVSELTNTFLLSGVLSENIAQTSMVLQAFSRMPECELHITGFDYDEDLIKSYSTKFENIIFHGRTSYQEYLDIMHSCTYQLSTRDENYPENQCNFPSKIIETLLHNRIVISTISYPQLKGINYFEVSSNVDDFISNIHAIINMPSSTLFNYANQGTKVAQLFSVNVWNETMSLIESREKI